jgi:hypothetical protein
LVIQAAPFNASRLNTAIATVIRLEAAAGFPGDGCDVPVPGRGSRRVGGGSGGQVGQEA